ncbi:MAG: sigma 54-dependent Fis family transcriptional regulator [Deltaproteobacteria bacterium]|nr:sigma 54-dependent Fis family transcriptional regulator [Deltaproteobacteria bacterium]
MEMQATYSNRQEQEIATQELSVPAAAFPDAPILVDLAGPEGGAARLPGGGPPRRRLLRPGASWVLGTGRDADLRVRDPAVSAHHCRLEHWGSRIEVIDMGSRNGVRVGGARVQRAELPLCSAFEIGRTSVVLGPATAPRGREGLPGMVGSSPAMRALAQMVRRCAGLRVPVLVRGESGTGKELVARAVHALGPCSQGPFVAVNAATLSPELAGSELFGHRRGAFTGAWADRQGAFKRAHGGTLLVDEVASLPAMVQAALLRVVEDGSVSPMGGDEAEEVRVRLVAATCEPLEQMVACGSFRADLYQRLAACVVPVPPLRERADDIPGLVQHLLRQSELRDVTVEAAALAELEAYRFPGNVRELRNVLVQAALRAEGQRIGARHVAAVLAERMSSRPTQGFGPDQARTLLRETGGNLSAAARRAGLPRSTFRDLAYGRARGGAKSGRGDC